MSDLERLKSLSGDVHILFAVRYSGVRPVFVNPGDCSGELQRAGEEAFFDTWHVVAPSMDLATAAFKSDTHGKLYTLEEIKPVCIVDEIITRSGWRA